MIEPYLPILYVAIIGGVAAVGLKAYFGLMREKVRAAARQQMDLSKPEAAVDQFFGMLQNAPQMLGLAKAELEKVRQQNKGKDIDLSAQETEIKWLETLARYQKPLMIVAPILNPIAKKYIKGLSKAI